MNEQKKLILTDIDGVVLNWEYAFHVWIQQHGYTQIEQASEHYDMHVRYDVEKSEIKARIRQFNESAAIGFLPPLRDAVHYIKKLHEKKGYVFHAITSLSDDPHAQQLRTQNLKKLFGETVFERFIYLDTGADKDEALLPYAQSGLLWVEDKPENAACGAELGLNAVLMEHQHNMNEDDNFQIFKNWKEIYEVM